MNPISKATSAIIHPMRTVTTVAGQTLGVAAAGVRTTMRIIDRAAGQRRGDSSTGWSTQGPPTTQAPVDKAAATKVSTRKTAAKKAPSARAATVGPALSRTTREPIEDEELRTPSGIPAADEGHNPDTTETDLHQPGTEPLMDPATVKSVRSEAEVMQRAADRHKS